MSNESVLGKIQGVLHDKQNKKIIYRANAFTGNEIFIN